MSSSHLRSSRPAVRPFGQFLPKCDLVLLVLRLIVCVTLLRGHFLAAQQTVASKDVSALIEQMGDDSYATRVRAREKLQQMGLEAFDELQAAQFHPDSEVVSSARYLINSLMVSWSKESDPADVRAALFEYGAQDVDERGSRIERIASLTNRQGIEALARLARYESDLALSRKAALALMQQPMAKKISDCQLHSEIITGVLRDSKRQSAAWLQVYANDLQTQKYSVEQWSSLVKQQRREIDASTSQQTNRVSVLSLVRTCAGRAADLGERNEAIRLSVDNIDLIPPTTRDLVEACNWATDIRLHEFVLKLQDKNSHQFSGNARLLYAAAEAQQVGGKNATAERLASQAIAIRSFPSSKEEKEELSENDIEQIAQAHLLLAQGLVDRGLFDWAEGEYRSILDGVELTSVTGARTRRFLSDMLGELLRHKDVVTVLEPLVQRVRKDAILRDKLDASLAAVTYQEGQLEYHRAMIAKKNDDMETARRQLQISYELYPGNVDVLIEMYRVSGDKDWETTVQRIIANRTRLIENEIRNSENRVRLPAQRVNEVAYLAQNLNEYAWLVSNTTGDYKKALAASKRSLELTPDDAAKIDTLARCYLTIGKLDDALEMQENALKRMPHSPPMIRQLQEIKDKLAER